MNSRVRPSLARRVLTTGAGQLKTDVRGMAKAVKAGLWWCWEIRWRRYLTGVIVLVTLGLILDLSTAIANGGAAGDQEASDDLLRLMTDAQDSHRLYLDMFTIETDRGGVTNLWNMFAALILFILFDVIYRSFMALALWMMEVVSSFMWMEVLRVPFSALSNVLNTLVADLGLVPLLLTVSVVISGVWIYRGRAGSGFGEMLVALVIGAMFTTWVAAPVEQIAGPDGAIEHARQLGITVSQSLLDDDDGGDEGSELSLPTTRLMDNLVRRPHQMINYGSDLDAKGADCAQAYNDAIRDGDTGGIRGACGEAAADRVDNPGGGLLPAFFILPAVFFLLALIFVLLITLILVCVLLTWEAAKFVLELLKGILPGTNRKGVWTSLCAVLIGLGLLVAGLMVLGLVIKAIEAMFSETITWPTIWVFAMIDTILAAAIVAVIVLTVRGWKGRRKAGKALADKTSPKPTPATMPSRTGAMALGMAKGAVAGRVLRRGNSGPPTPSPSTAGSGPPGAAAPAEPGRGGKLGAATRAAYQVGKGAVAYTAGAPVAVPRAVNSARAAMAARKQALEAKIAAAKQSVGEYGKEYAHNVGAAGEVAAKASGAKWAVEKVRERSQARQNPDPATGAGRSSDDASSGPPGVEGGNGGDARAPQVPEHGYSKPKTPRAKTGPNQKVPPSGADGSTRRPGKPQAQQEQRPPAEKSDEGKQPSVQPPRSAAGRAPHPPSSSTPSVRTPADAPPRGLGGAGRFGSNSDAAKRLLERMERERRSGPRQPAQVRQRPVEPVKAGR